MIISLEVQNIELCHSFTFSLGRYYFSIVPMFRYMVLVKNWRWMEKRDYEEKEENKTTIHLSLDLLENWFS